MKLKAPWRFEAWESPRIEWTFDKVLLSAVEEKEVEFPKERQAQALALIHSPFLLKNRHHLKIEEAS